MAKKWHDINSPGFVINQPRETSANQPAETDENNAQEQQVDAEVRLVSAQWVAGPNGYQFNERCFVDVKVEFLKETSRKRILGELFGIFEGREHDLLFQVSGPIDAKTNIARLETKLFYIEEYYQARREDPQLSCEYVIKNISHSRGANTLDSASLHMPSGEHSTWRCDCVEMPDTLFNHNSAVPCLDREGVLSGALGAAFVFAKNNHLREAVLFGHTDTSGDPAYNYDLSGWRAQAIKAIIDNDSDAFLATVDVASKVEDYQTILKSLTEGHGWGCDPGAVDDINGPKTQAALKAFQEQYNNRFSGELKVDGKIGPKTWTAIFFVTRYQVEELVKKECGQVPVINYGYSGKGIYPCGESFPIEAAAKDNYRSKANRRVEIVFFEQGHCPVLTEPVDKKKVTIIEAPVYDSSKTEKIIIEHLGTRPGEVREVTFVAKTMEENPIVGVEVTLTLDDGSTFTQRSNQDGVAIFKEVPESAAGKIEYADEDDLLNKSFAANFNGAINKKDHYFIILLLQSAVDFSVINSLYQTAYNEDLGESIRKTFTDEEIAGVIDFLLIKTGLIIDSNVVVVEGDAA